MGLLNTIETLLTVMEKQPQIMAQLQPIVLQVIAHIFRENVMGKLYDRDNENEIKYVTSLRILPEKCILFSFILEFYEEALLLVYDLTGKAVSEDMWKVLEWIYQLFQKDGFDYFTDMMPALHNYVTVDTQAFLSNENHVLAMFNMCKAVCLFITIFLKVKMFLNENNLFNIYMLGTNWRCRRRSRMSRC